MPATNSPIRPFSALKLALSAIVGVAIALVVVQRPLTAPLPDTVEIADMTWVEVRSAIARGYSTVIVPSGGIEQNGPHMILGKHDYIVRATAKRIAAQLGHALVAPVISLVPEGDYDPPTGHLRFPGTIGVSEMAYAGVLEGAARSLKAGGFTTICFIADMPEASSRRPKSPHGCRRNGRGRASASSTSPTITPTNRRRASSRIRARRRRRSGSMPASRILRS